MLLPNVLSAQTVADTSAESAAPAAAIDESTLIIGEISSSGDASVTVSPFGFWDLLRMILVLGCVIAVIYLVFFLFKRSGSARVGSAANIRVLGSQTLPGNRSVYLIEAAGQVFMIGAGGDSVNLIAEITDKESIDEMILRAGDTVTGPRKSFGDMVAGLLKNGQAGTLDLMKNQRARLQKLR